MSILLNTDFWVAISFGVFCFVLWKFGAAALLNMLDTRIANIRKEIQTAEDAGEIRKKADQDLQESVARREKQLMQRLKLMEESAMTEIREHAATLAMEATTAIIAESLDKKNGERLIADSIKALPKDIH